MKLEKKQNLAQKRRWRIRKKVAGTVERPRLSLHFSNKHGYAQCIDDVGGITLFYLSTLAKDLRSQKILPNVEGAKKFGKEFGERAKAIGIKTVVFDRSGRRYHGAVKAFAESARESLKF